MNLPTLPRLGAGLALVVAIGIAGSIYHHHVYQLGYDTAVADRAARDGVAVLHRTAENAITAATQASINTVITKAKNEELAPVGDRIATERVRVGTGICGPAPTADAKSTSSSDSTNPSGRLVRSDIERDIIALKLAVEEDLATGRACQAFVQKNGLEP